MQVEARRDLLNKSVLFHTHYNEIMEWYGRMEVKNAEYAKVSTSIEVCETKREEWMVESDATAQVSWYFPLKKHRIQRLSYGKQEDISEFENVAKCKSRALGELAWNKLFLELEMSDRIFPSIKSRKLAHLWQNRVWRLFIDGFLRLIFHL